MKKIKYIILSMAMLLMFCSSAFAIEASNGAEPAMVTSYPASEEATARYEQGAEYCMEKGYMVGTGKDFDIDELVTRAQIVQTLYAKEGKPSTEKIQNNFTDVPEGKWYSEAVNWAASQELVAGYGNGKFGPSDILTREQVAVILYKYAEYKDLNLDIRVAVSDGNTHSWAEKQVNWALGNGVLSGTSRGIAPRGACTRGMLAAAWQAFDENVEQAA